MSKVIKLSQLDQDVIDSIASAQLRADGFVGALNELCARHGIDAYLLTFAVPLDEPPTQTPPATVLASTSRFEQEYQLMMMQDKMTVHVDDQLRRMMPVPINVVVNHFFNPPTGHA